MKLLSLSTKVALLSSHVFRSWSFTVFRRSVSVRRVFGMTLLTYTDVATDFAVRSRRLTSLLASSAVASPMVSLVPATMTISLIVCVLRPAYTIQLLLRRALCRRPTVVGRTRTLSDYAQQDHAHYATKVGSNSVRITAFVADLLKVNVARPSGFKLVNLVVCYHGFHKPEKQTCRNKILID